ncbi:MAG: ABC transporter permease subunit [Alphaproteobacteria bacterium]|nr:ABC transporter permease subunit [Alphaproteobacteria bacterium]
MTHLLLAARLDVAESARSRWFLLYAGVFGVLVALMLIFGLAESRVMGFTGLSRLLVTYVQVAMAILPVFILITTVRSIAGDREAGVTEYMLSLPVPLAAWYWGKFAGRFLVAFLPVLATLGIAVGWGLMAGGEVPWGHLAADLALLVSLIVCFLGFGFLISSVARSTDVAQGAAFFLWLVLLVFMDLVMLGVLIREHLPPELAVTVALANPLQVFRTASMMLFDPQLVLLGPAAYVILDHFGPTGWLAWGIAYPAALGGVAAGAGYLVVRRGDLV